MCSGFWELGDGDPDSEEEAGSGHTEAPEAHFRAVLIRDHEGTLVVVEFTPKGYGVDC